MNTKDYLNEYVMTADKHVVVLEKALKKVLRFVPYDSHKLENCSDDDVTSLDSITLRFSKLQDLIGSKIFPILLNIYGQDSPDQTFIDKLNKLEKLNFLESAHIWRVLRDFRNNIADEYSLYSEKLSGKINEVIKGSMFLVSYWKELKQKIEKIEVQ